MRSGRLPDGLLSLRAAALFSVAAPPITPGFVTIENGQILSCGQQPEASRVIDLGQTALLPALINAHTHLEFSDRHVPFGSPYQSFSEWILQVVENRRERSLETGAVQAEQAVQIARRKGLDESVDRGVGIVGEISTTDRPIPSTPGITGVNFLEILGLGAHRHDSLLARARMHLETAAEIGWIRGLSPHSPYTVDPDLLRKLCSLAIEHRAPLAMHLAETQPELELIQSHSGSLVETLRRLDAWYPGAIPRGIAPRDYLEILSVAPRCLIIHGNYLGPDEWEILRKQPQMHIIFCPRTHAFFHRGKYPLMEMLKAGVRVGLGTDSRASNPDLSLLAEMRFLADRYQECEDRLILELGTIRSAEALGVEPDFGSIEPKKVARFMAMQLPDSPTNIWDTLLRSDSAATLVYQDSKQNSDYVQA